MSKRYAKCQQPFLINHYYSNPNNSYTHLREALILLIQSSWVCELIKRKYRYHHHHHHHHHLILWGCGHHSYLWGFYRADSCTIVWQHWESWWQKVTKTTKLTKTAPTLPYSSVLLTLTRQFCQWWQKVTKQSYTAAATLGKLATESLSKSSKVTKTAHIFDFFLLFNQLCHFWQSLLSLLTNTTFEAD